MKSGVTIIVDDLLGTLIHLSALELKPLVVILSNHMRHGCK